MTAPLPVTLFDYGVGNLHSITKALELSGAVVERTRDPQRLLVAEHIVLPGVGAFGATMEPLIGVREALRDRLAAGTHCLAVCIGMQLLYEESEESPGVPGIGLLAGRIRRLPATVGKIPHMGWNTIVSPAGGGAGGGAGGDGGARWRPALPPTGTHVYFVHSYYAEPQDKAHTLLATRYGSEQEVEFPAVVAARNTLATQFHPEKSGPAGLGLLAAWVQHVQGGREGAGQGPKIDTPPEASRSGHAPPARPLDTEGRT